MPAITDLPCAIVGAILGNLDHLRHLSPALLACRHFYTSFRETHGVEASILRHQVTPALLPFAVVLIEASRLPRIPVAGSVIPLFDEPYSRPAHLAARVPTLPTSLVRKMGRTHDAIHAFATDFASSARDRISPGTSAIVLSPSEYFRFCHAFYQIELIYTLLRHRASPPETCPWFFSRHAPWENEQLACAYERLEAVFAKASFDVVAHDIDFGETWIDYLTLSQGIEFVQKLTLADSYATKQAMLQSGLSLKRGSAILPLHLLHVAPVPVGDDGELHSIAPSRSDRPDDRSDRGPYEAWRSAQACARRPGSVMAPDTVWLRERAYVLWDGERVKKQTKGFGETPQYDTPYGYTAQDFEDMYESFRERSKIWRKAGTGYWSKGDTSRVVW